ncbi:hypothetical protein ACQRAB_11270 [Megasphaera elsdenii]|uniref:hypothetical protein n=1 Tax=Megasphaera elsdenii TaxID=907 RepID=UPI00266F6F4A|nr:hypothetical protein [Megasphaera elsdenii]
MQKKALIILCVLVLTSSGYAAPPAHAAIPVIDVDNITQQLKTYQETVKVVMNTKEQVELQWKELKKLPSQILNGYKTSLINGWNKIQDILTKNGTVIYGTTGTISDKGVPDLATAHTIYINDYFSKNIPAIIGNDLPETLGSARTARLITLATLMRNNADTLSAIQKLMGELDSINEEIQQAEEDSANAEGAMQAQQAANHIAALQLRAQNIKIIIQGLQGQQQALKSQAEAQQKKNELDMQEAQGKAEVAAIEEMQNNDSSGFSPTYDPYKGHLHFEW